MNITRRFSLAMIVVVSIIILGFAVVLSFQSRHELERELSERVAVIASIAEKSLPIPMWNVDVKSLDDFLAALFADHAIVYAEYVIEGGTSFVNKSNFKRSPAFDAHDWTFFAQSPNFLAHHVDIFSNDKRIGLVRFAASKANIQAAMQRKMFTIGIATLVLMVAISLTSIGITSRSILRPLNMLQISAERLARGQLDEPIDVTRRDELGRLAWSFANMRDAIRQQMNELKQINTELSQEIEERLRIETELQRHRDHLEEEVHARTAELSKANARLQKEIKDRKRAEKAANAANHAKTEFLATMSHEIRTPLNAVLGFTELLDQIVTGARERSYLEAIQTGSKNLLRLINDILDIAKIEAGKITLEYEPVHLKKLLEYVTHIFSIKIREKNLDLMLEIEESLPDALLLDEVRLRQILYNLIGNAIKFTDKGYIKLTSGVVSKTVDGKYIDLSLTVEDTGIGIPVNAQERIFQAFEKYENKDGMRKVEGTGLGLAISKRLTEIMGGKMTLTSEVEKGSVFTLILPKIEIASSADILRQEVEEPPIDVSKLQGTIMIVDDVESNRRLVKETFIGSNIVVIEAVNGNEALEKINDRRPDLIFMDLVMPVMNGIDACKAIKSNSDLKSIPVVAITASSAQTREELHFFDGYLRKPVSIAELLEEICNHLECPGLENIDSSQKDSNEYDNVMDIDLLLLIINDSFFPRWESFRERQPLKEVDLFGKELYQLAEKHNSNILMDFGQSLRGCVDRFDIEKMRQILSTFPDLVGRLAKL